MALPTTAPSSWTQDLGLPSRLFEFGGNDYELYEDGEAFVLSVEMPGFDLEEASALQSLPGLGVPTLLVEGGNDRNLPPERHTRVLFEAAANPDQITRVAVPGATHLNLARKPWPELEAALERFLEQHGRPASSP